MNRPETDLYSRTEYLDAARILRSVLTRKRDCEGAYYLLLRCLFACGQHQEVVAIAEDAIEASGTDYTLSGGCASHSAGPHAKRRGVG